MVIMANSNMKNRFRGALLGALVGDCLGARFEGLAAGSFSPDDVIEQIELSEGEEVDLSITDDTQMTQELADALIENSDIIPKDLARRFVERYYLDGINVPYGANVVRVFQKLRDTNYSDPFLPAKEQFHGTGSLGNGAAMRVSPVALFCVYNAINAAQLAKLTAVITHTHEDGIDGAIFQCLAIRRCLVNPVTDAEMFLDSFIADLREVKVSEKYVRKLRDIATLLKITDVRDSVVIECLGNGVTAFTSVPTALFCFLRGLSQIPGCDAINPFRRTMEYAIRLGGDTDTIASMAGAIAGANYGMSAIKVGTWKSCEQSEKAIKQADDLFDKINHADQS